MKKARMECIDNWLYCLNFLTDFAYLDFIYEINKKNLILHLIAPLTWLIDKKNLLAKIANIFTEMIKYNIRNMYTGPNQFLINSK